MKVLFICPKFFGYEKEISDALKRKGHEVTYIDEKPSNNVFYKILLRLRKDSLYIRRSVDSYFKSVLQNSPEDVDMILILKGESLTESIVKNLRKKYSKAKIVFYAWDSIVNYPQVQNYLYLCDFKFTFDDRDIKNFDGMNHLPLFFSPAFMDSKIQYNCQGDFSHKKNKVAFLGSVHSDRYALLGRFYQLHRKTLDCDFVLYFPSAVVLCGFIFRNFKNILKYKLLSFSLRPRSKREIADFFLSADAVLDIQHPGQSGLTMRTLECIPLQRKMITTNPEIKNYDFYNESNYFILDRNSLLMDYSFFRKTFSPTDENIINKYSVDHWVSVLCSPVNQH
ncbi:hypothetical protein ACVWV0_003949 [Ewingella americana]